ncbi:hypothetical protein NW759_001855 [Fusarium solani]|nr:hypothetical protein NW759_001855 [Fusarium solani]
MAERNLEHRTQSSRFNPGDFAAPWVGKNPLIVKRRQYRTAHLNWILPFLAQRQQVLEHERKIRKEAEQTVVARYIANGLFEYQVDRFYWESWLESMSPNAPKCPWSKPAENPTDEWSATFATLISDDEVNTMVKEWLEGQGREMPPNESSEESDLSNLFLVFSQRAKGLHVIGAHRMPAETVVGLANTLAQEEHRDNLHRFQGRGKLDTWFCLNEVYKKGDNAINALDPHRAGCRDHGQIPSFAATIGASSGSKLGPPKGIQDSIWAPSSSASKAAAKSVALPPVAPRLVSTHPAVPRSAVAQPAAQQAIETKPKGRFSL